MIAGPTPAVGAHLGKIFVGKVIALVAVVADYAGGQAHQADDVVAQHRQVLEFFGVDAEMDARLGRVNQRCLSRHSDRFRGTAHSDGYVNIAGLVGR